MTQDQIVALAFRKLETAVETHPALSLHLPASSHYVEAYDVWAALEDLRTELHMLGVEGVLDTLPGLDD